ncbi:MAG: hypothetical protein JSS51_06880 [Planctomycetes bacterium]|nr:hypothetical protein [Planctomycetota bacterium]
MRTRPTISSWKRLTLLAALACLPALADPPADEPIKPEGPAAGGLARRPNPKLAEKSASGKALKPFANHRKMGAVYHLISAREFSVAAAVNGLKPSTEGLIGYVVARVPLDAAGNGALGPVLVAGQWQIPWTSLVDAATLSRWSKAGGGPLNLEDYPSVAITIRNAVETRRMSKDESGSTYMCTLIADISVNGLTTERVIPRAMVTFASPTTSDQSVKGEQLTLKAKWKVRLSDFFTSLPGQTALPIADVSADLLMSTVSPDGQSDEGDSPPEPAPEEPKSPSSEPK